MKNDKQMAFGLLLAIFGFAGGAVAADWSGMEVIKRSMDVSDRVNFDLQSGYPCGQNFEYKLDATHSNFTQLAIVLKAAAYDEEPINVEYTGAGCSKIVVNITQ